MSYKSRVFFGSAYYFLGGVVAALLAYVIKLILVRNLSVEDYGLFFSVFTFVMLFGALRTLGMNAGLVRFIAKYKSKKRYGQIKSLIIGSFLMQIAFSLFLVALLWVLSDFLATSYFGDEDAKWLLRIVSFYLPLTVIESNYRATMNGLGMNKWLSSTTFFKHLFTLIILLLALLFGYELFAPAFAYVFGLILFGLLFGKLVFRESRFFKTNMFKFKVVNKKLLWFSLPLVFTGIGGMFISYFDTLMLTYFSTLEIVGIYNIVYPTAILIALVASSIGNILMPVISELWSLNRKKEIQNAFHIIYKYLAMLLFPLIFTLIVLSEYLLGLFFGSEYVSGALAFNVLLFGALFKMIFTLNNKSLIGLGDSRKTLEMYILGAICNVGLNLVFIPLFGLIGAAVATSISFLIMILASFFFLNEKAHVTFPARKVIVIFLLALLLPIFILLFQSLDYNIYFMTILGFLIGSGSYILGLWGSGLLDVDELRDLLI